MVALGAGQFQFNGVKFGRNTMLPVSGFDTSAYGVTGTDYQIAQADEMRFGRDALQPGTLTLTINALDNRPLPNMVALSGPRTIQTVSATDTMEKLATAWKSDITRNIYGAVDVLYYNRKGSVVQIYGRARKFATNAPSRLSQYRVATAEFQRVDTKCYSDIEYNVTVLPGSEGVTTQNIVRSDGYATTWLQMFIYGPVTHPKIKIGSLPLIDINYTLPAGHMVEINSYPWQRRVVNDSGDNLRPLLINDSPYLDQIQVLGNATTGVGLSGSSTTSATKLLVLWREAYNSL